MRFKCNETQRDYNLNKIIGSDFWSDLDGDLYVTDERTGLCYSVSGLNAVESLLRRDNIKRDIGCFCQRKGCRMGSNALEIDEILNKRLK
jgi:hypothetical protein